LSTFVTAEPVPQAVPGTRPGRFDSIDQVRGAIMVLMALDHVRWFFTEISTFQPETLANTNFWLFMTRWVTHFCAPGFFLLAGMAICLYNARIEYARDLRRYLVSRGVLLIMLELTIVGYAWVFSPGFSFGGVIWSLGCSFLIMAALVSVPKNVLLAGAAFFLIFHNLLLDELPVPVNAWLAFLWRAIYQPGPAVVPIAETQYFFLFPILPWLAVMVLGHALGHWYHLPDNERRLRFTRAGAAMILGFVVLRLAGNFGNPDTLWISPVTAGEFSLQADLASTIISFLNTEKYPPSLQFALMTLGPLLLWLGLSRVDSGNTRPNLASKALILFGRVPLFYYLCHLYLIHLLALVVTSVAGQPNDWIRFGADPAASRPEGYGFGLPVVHLTWIGVTLILYVVCRKYECYKRTHTYAWLKYL